MSTFPKISDSEWKVIQVIWDNKPNMLTSTQIIEILKESTKWNPKTIHTLISRLVKKKAVGVKYQSPKNLYYALIDEDYCKSKETKNFLDKIYNGSLKLLVKNFITNDNISEKELKELKKMIDKQGGK